MKAKKYIKKLNSICRTYRPKGDCSDCPLHHHLCGIPDDSNLLDEALKIVKKFTEPPKKYLCPQCKNEEHDSDASYCIICGLEIRKGGEGND